MFSSCLATNNGCKACWGRRADATLVGFIEGLTHHIGQFSTSAEAYHQRFPPNLVPVKRTFIKDDFVAKDDNIELSVRYQSVEDISAWFTSRFDV